jgi:uncharacterized protein with GYD domain
LPVPKTGPLHKEKAHMAGYITLVKYTQQGISAIKDSPTRMQQVRAMAEKMGVRMIGIWVTMGQYDLVAVWDAPGDESMASVALAVGRNGFVTTQTMRAFSEEEFAKIVSGL